MEVVEEEIKAKNVSLCEEPNRFSPAKPSSKETIKKVGSHDVKKPTGFKDWNTPWIRRDGKGLKTILRNVNGVDPVTAPVRTSHNHFYSEPHSFLGPEPEPIPLEKIEEMREAIARAHDLERRQAHQHPEALLAERGEERMEVTPPSSLVRDGENDTPVHPESETCEESEPPELEEILERSSEVQTGGKVNIDSQKTTGKPLYDVQEEEPQESVTSNRRQEEEETLEDQQATNVLDLETLKKTMENFSNVSGYEPSADELIQVLKNLENLAASNAPMYMALVQLIQANQSNEFNDNMNLMNGDGTVTGVRADSEGEEEPPRMTEVGKEVLNSGEQELHHLEPEKEELPSKGEEVGSQEGGNTEESSKEQGPILNKDEKLEDGDIMQRIAVKKQEVRRRVHAEPRKIKVVAGSQHRASWPCAPSVTNTTAPKVIEVILGETEEDSFRNRRDVAEKAGLKHIDVILGDESFYPQLFEDFDYPWKGSLRPVSDSLNRHGIKDLDPDCVPWASSLRHVPESQKRKKPSKTSSSAAPWIGTLRHVKSTNNPPKTFTKPQFKRYPDEDAPNPFQGLSGRDARPAYPLTPAATLNRSSSPHSFDNANEDVDRIRNNLRETRAISNTLLRVLMPKLLKEHESKYEPLSFEESQRIMDEILGQKIGLMDNEGLNDAELEKEIDEALLGKVEKGLKAALSGKKKEGKSKKKKKKVTSASSSKKLEGVAETVPAST